MCRFVTILAPQDCRSQASAVLKQHRSYVSETHNADLARAAPANSIQLISPRAGCDCSTILDAPWRQDRENFDSEKLAEKWRRKGWSEAKIERSLADKAHGKATTTHRESSDSFELWATVLDELAQACSEHGSIGILLHEYSGSLDTEEMSPQVKRATVENSSLEALQQLKEDELLVFDNSWLKGRKALGR